MSSSKAVCCSLLLCRTGFNSRPCVLTPESQVIAPGLPFRRPSREQCVAPRLQKNLCFTSTIRKGRGLRLFMELTLSMSLFTHDRQKLLLCGSVSSLFHSLCLSVSRPSVRREQRSASKRWKKELPSLKGSWSRSGRTSRWAGVECGRVGSRGLGTSKNERTDENFIPRTYM